MAHAQVRAWPEASGLGRLRDKAAAMARASSAYSSFRRSRQNSSVSLTTASKAGRMALGTDVGRSDLAMPDLVPGGARRRAGSARGDGAGGRPGPRRRVADPLREAWIGSPPAHLEGGLVAAVEAELAHERPVLAELGVAVAAGRVHLVGALPGEAHILGTVAAVEAAMDGAEDELAATLLIEGDVGGLDQVEEVGVSQRHLDDPPLAEQGVVAGGHQVATRGSSAGAVGPARGPGVDGCAGRSALQAQGRRSPIRLAGWSGSRASTSASQACGSTPFSCVPCEGALVPWVQVPPGNSRSSRKHPGRIRR